MSSNARDAIRRLRSEREVDPFLRISLFVLLALFILSWPVGGFSFGELAAENRLDNVVRFLREAIPYPLQSGVFDSNTLAGWAAGLWVEKGRAALGITFGLSIVAISLAGLLAAATSPFAARALMSSQPFIEVLHLSRPWHLRLVTGTTRLVFVFVRSIPEYIWAFIFLSLLGPGFWPVILALAIHNWGVLGRLNADAFENLPPMPLGALTMLGARRAQVLFGGALPAVFPRMLLFFFYRWETCVRESTVLGMLGVVSLGFWIQDARARNFTDEMLFFIALGALLVAAGDVISSAARRYARDA